MITLRPYQQSLKNDILTAWSNGARVVAGIMPTGAGKSLVLSDLILDGDREGLTQCVAAHRQELVAQMSMHVARRGIKHRIVASKSTIAQITREHRAELGRSYVNPDARCAVASVQTINARSEILASWGIQVQRFYGDEFHHYLRTNTFGKCAELFPNARILGVTATPARADGMGLGAHADGIVDQMVIGPQMRWLIDNGALTDYEIACPPSDLIVDDDEFAASGDLSPKKGRLASKKSHIVGDVVQEYIKRAVGKRAICFTTDVETAGEVAQNFTAHGIPSAAVSAKTPENVRYEMIQRFKRGQLLTLVNVDLFGEGFDCPACEVVIMARPTQSLAVYMQQFGRALRPMEGKTHGLIIDHVSNWKRHGLPDRNRSWTLDRREKRAKRAVDPDDIPLRACGECSRPYERALPRCPYCGAEPPLPAPGARSLEQVDGDLMLLDRERLAQMRAAMALESPGDMETRVAHAAGQVAGVGARKRQQDKIAAQGRLQAAIEQWAGVRRHLGDTDQMSHRRLWLATGMSALEMLAADRSTADYERDATMVEGWYL